MKADVTVSFARLKVGHFLLPGRALCGERVLAQIGLPDDAVNSLAVRCHANRPGLWRTAFPVPDIAGHKYSRGHAVVVSGTEATGAARLAARAALRSGAGLVTVASPPSVAGIHASALDAVMVRAVNGADGLSRLLEDRRKNAVAIGPGAGVGEPTRQLVQAVLEAGPAATIDADALTSFADDPGSLWKAVATQPERAIVLTPHDGEFARLFGSVPAVTAMSSKLERTRAAARHAGAVIILKGADTVVAAPDGRAVIADNAPPWLASAGTGDVLSGVVAGLLAQGMPPFEAAAAAVWLHGEAGNVVGPGLIAEDLPLALRSVLAVLFHRWNVPGAPSDPLV